MYISGRVLAGFCLFCCLAAANSFARAHVRLIVETSTGVLGFLSDVGHSSVWIFHGCLDQSGEVRCCENSQGIVLTSTAYWPNPGAAAIPAELYFLGSRPGAGGRSAAAWDEALGTAYPDVPPKYGRKYLGRVWRRSMRVTPFTTTPEEDQRVLEQVEQQRRTYQYSYSHRNCAFYAQQVLRLYLGDSFHANRSFDFGVYTPRALERGLQRRLGDQHVGFRVIRFRGTLSQSWRQPPRTFSESAIFDPKHAVVSTAHLCRIRCLLRHHSPSCDRLGSTLSTCANGRIDDAVDVGQRVSRCIGLASRQLSKAYWRVANEFRLDLQTRNLRSAVPVTEELDTTGLGAPSKQDVSAPSASLKLEKR